MQEISMNNHSEMPENTFQIRPLPSVIDIDNSQAAENKPQSVSEEG